MVLQKFPRARHNKAEKILEERLTPGQWRDWQVNKAFNIRRGRYFVRVYPTRGDVSTVVMYGRTYNIFISSSPRHQQKQRGRLQPAAKALAFLTAIPAIPGGLANFSCYQRSHPEDVAELRKYGNYGGEI
jgi:hypothetical protein